MFHHWRNALGVVVLLCTVSAPSWAKPGDALNWSFQDTTISNSGTGQTAVAMRSGLAWPVIISDYPQYSAYTLYPVGGKNGGPGWLPYGSNLIPRGTGRLRSANSPDGRFAIVANDSGSPTYVTGAVNNGPGSWTSLPLGTKAVAFDRKGTLYTATATSVSAGPKFPGSNILDLAVSPNGDIGVIDSSRKYWQYSSWVGSWLSTTMPPTSSIEPQVSLSPQSIDLEFDSLSRPHVVGSSTTGLYAFDFDIVSGTWQSTTLATGQGIGGNFLALAANNKNQIATAWVNTDGTLVYASKTDNAPWTLNTVTSSAYRTQLVGVTFDYADLPVLSYVGATPRTYMLAYDPVLTPEPATFGLLAAASLLSLRRRRI